MLFYFILKLESSQIFEIGKIYEPKADKSNKNFLSNEVFKNLNLDKFEFKKIPECVLCESLETPYLKYLK